MRPTLVEVLIVVVVLGILAGVVIPQFSSSSDEAKLSELDTALAELRGAVEVYYHQHNSVYPGETNWKNGLGNFTWGRPVPVDMKEERILAAVAESFVRQLTLYSSVNGETAPTPNDGRKFGPYVKRGIPKNPFNGLASVKCDITMTDVAVSDGTTGWLFYVKTGTLMANDGRHDSR